VAAARSYTPTTGPITIERRAPIEWRTARASDYVARGSTVAMASILRRFPWTDSCYSEVRSRGVSSIVTCGLRSGLRGEKATRTRLNQSGALSIQKGGQGRLGGPHGRSGSSSLRQGRPF
jgi:hypothetical protein